MIKNRVILSLSFVAITAFASAQSEWKMQDDLEYHFQRVDYWRSRMQQDSAAKEDSILRDRLLYYTNTYPATLRDNFKLLKYYDHLNVLSSDDNSFRIYSWDDGNARQHNFINVFQYKGNDKSVQASVSIPGNDVSTLKGREYRRLYTMKTKGRVYYLATFITPRSKDDYSMGVEVFSKNSEGGLDDSTHIIVNNTYGTAVNELEYEMGNASGAVDHCIYFDKSSKQLYVPIIWQDGVVSTAYTEYRFKNNYFTEVKK
jgi:hypothetical protein